MSRLYSAPSGSQHEGPGTTEEEPHQKTRTTTVALIGAGRVGTALTVLLERAGHRVVAASGRKDSEERARQHLPFSAFHPWSEAPEAAKSARVVILGVTDDVIEQVCSELVARVAIRRGQAVVHLSGSVGLDALEAARMVGALTLSIHPLQTFPDVETGIERLPGSAVAVTAPDDRGYAVGLRLAQDVGGRPFRLEDEDKALYHAAAVFCSNYLVAVEAMAEHLFKLAGLPDPLPMFAPLARSSLYAALWEGPEKALTGPAVRGDGGTIRRNLEALSKHAPEAVAPYVALAQVAAGLGLRSGRLSREGFARVVEALKGWS
jgi:predicted short-subunit dehydrogenase-like oxidoreductase (DUF2520 family)